MAGGAWEQARLYRALSSCPGTDSQKPLVLQTDLDRESDSFGQTDGLSDELIGAVQMTHLITPK